MRKPRRIAPTTSARGRHAAGIRRPSAPPARWRWLRSAGSWVGWSKTAKAIATFGTLVTALAAVGALYSTNQTLDATRQQIGITEQGQYTDRFGKAVEQLGSDKTDVRLGGIYALERLARDSVKDSATSIEVLAAFVRDSLQPATDPRRCLQQPDSGATAQALPTDVHAALTVLDRRTSDGIGGSSPDLSGVCLSRYTDLTSMSFKGDNLHDARFDFQNLTGVNFHQAYLSGISFNAAYLFRADLSDAKMAGANLSGANLTEADLRGVNLYIAHLEKVNLTRAYMDGAVLERAILTNAKLYGANLAGANMRYANLSGADLTNATLVGADLRGANLDNANLTGANLQGAQR